MALRLSVAAPAVGIRVQGVPPSLIVAASSPSIWPFHCSVPCLIFGDKLTQGHVRTQALRRDDTGNPVPPRAFAWRPTGWAGKSSSSSPSGAIRRAPAQPPARCPGPPGSGEPGDRGALSRHLAGPAGLLDGAVPPPIWDSGDSSSASPGVASIPMPSTLTRAHLAGTAAGLDCCLCLVRQHHGCGMPPPRRAGKCPPPTVEIGRPPSTREGPPATVTCMHPAEPQTWMAWRHMPDEPTHLLMPPDRGVAAGGAPQAPQLRRGHPWNADRARLARGARVRRSCHRLSAPLRLTRNTRESYHVSPRTGAAQN